MFWVYIFTSNLQVLGWVGGSLGCCSFCLHYIFLPLKFPSSISLTLQTMKLKLWEECVQVTEHGSDRWGLWCRAIQIPLPSISCRYTGESYCPTEKLDFVCIFVSAICPQTRKSIYRYPTCINFLGLLQQITTSLVAENRNLFSHGSGGQQSKIKVSAGPCFLWILGENPILDSSSF